MCLCVCVFVVAKFVVPVGSDRTCALSFGWDDCIGCIWGSQVFSFYVVCCWVLGVGCWVLGGGWWVLGVGCWVLGVGCWVLGVGYWVLVVGCWVLGVGCWVFC